MTDNPSYLGVRVHSLKQQGITDIVIPCSRLVVFLVLAALYGLSVTLWPARRAARFKVAPLESRSSRP